ncbi:MAG: chemotaxis protein CheA [Gammaproteobacteria bacterium]|nr:chemotaxis protein CheA [Gammaproteobacteria bacterium]
MTSDLSQFHEAFFEEAAEGLELLESGLLALVEGNQDEGQINDIFRAAHSIKGGSGMFGFTEITNLTHVMETMLDEMRAGDRQAGREDVDLLLKATDCVSAMIDAPRSGNPVDCAEAEDMRARLEARLAVAPGAMPAALPAGDAVEVVEAAGESARGDWRIRFGPTAAMYAEGHDPLRIMRELASLGEAEVSVDAAHVPPLEDFDPAGAYLCWEIILKDGPGRRELEEVFAWVKDSCELTIESEHEAGTTARPVAPAPDNVVAMPGAAPESAAPAPTAPAPAAVASGADNGAPATRESSSIRVSTDKVDTLINMVGELVITQSMLGQFNEEFELVQFERLKDGLAQLERNTRELQESVMRIRMMPIKASFSRFPRLVRDLSQGLGKSVRLELVGEHTELDKTVLEKIGDPLVHLVRNSLDHGIESAEERRAKGKDPTGVLRLKASHQGGNIVIEVSDDGAGLNTRRILDKAIEKGIVSAQDELSDEQVADLIFQPGFSTAAQVSDVSGRGVGMDVVRRNINDLNGTVDVKTVPGEGSTFTIRLPLTLAILDGQLIRVGEQIYVIPLISIVESLLVNPGQIKSIGADFELYRLRDNYVPVARLHSIFGVDAANADLKKGLLVIVESNDGRLGLMVDDLLGQQQVVIKSLESNFKRVSGISGATILGDGSVALILDISGLVKICQNRGEQQDSGKTEDRTIEAVA